MTSSRRPLTRSAAPGSLLGRVIAVFVLVLTTSAGLVALFETSQNRDAMRRTSLDFLEAEAGALAGDIRSEQEVRAQFLADLQQQLAFAEAVAARDRAAIDDFLRPLRSLDEFDHVVLAAGEGLVVPFPTPEAPVLPTDRSRLTGELILFDALGTPHLAVATRPFDGAVLVGSVRLGDATANRLRSRIPARGEVLLVVNGLLVGKSRTFSGLPPAEDDFPPAPLFYSGSGEVVRLLGEPMASPDGVVELEGEPKLLAYTALVGATSTGGSAHVGVLIDDPLAVLRADLLRNRAIAVALLAFIGLGLALVLLRMVTRPVSQLTDAATRIAEGDLDHDFTEVRGAGELEDLAGALDRMVAMLKRHTTTIRRQALDLRRATERLVHARDDERRAMAATLHDGFQQRLVVLRMKVGSLGEDSTPEQRAEIADELLALLGDLRRLSHDLYPSILRDRGLAAALHSLVGRVAADVDLELAPAPFPRLPFEVEANAYFLVAEGLTNALKHAPGARVHVTARVFHDELEVCVLDEGPGFDVRAQRGAGLTGFEDRAAAVGGTCILTSDQNGTWIVARVPLPADPERPATSRSHLDDHWAELMAWQDAVERGEVDLDAWHARERAQQEQEDRRVSAAALEEQQDGGDPTVEVGRV